jgi:hypothetical protein
MVAEGLTGTMQLEQALGWDLNNELQLTDELKEASW